MLPCFRCGAPAVGRDGVCGTCGMRAFASPYIAATVGHHPRRQIKGLGLALMIMLGVTAAEFLVVVVAQAWRHHVVSQIIAAIDGTGDDPALSTVQSSDDLARTTAGLAVILFLTCAILTLCWLYAARCNAETYSPYVFRLSQGWAIGGWFVPVGYLFLPLMVALDTHRGTVAGSTPGRRPSGGAVTGWWWGFWLAGLLGLFTGFAVGGSKGSDTTDPLHDLHEMQATSAAVEPGFVLLAVAAVLLLLYVRKITNIQAARAGEPFGGWMPPPLPMAGYGVPAPYGAPGPYGIPASDGTAPVPYGQAPYGAPAGYGPAPYGMPPQQNPYGGPDGPAAPPPDSGKG